MERIVLQPAASSEAQQHYRDTIQHPVPLNQVLEAFPEEQHERLRRLYPDEVVPVWGVTPGTNGANANRWRRITYGDVALFTGGGRIFASASITLKTRSPELALALWGRNDASETWEYIYLLSPEVRRQNVPYERFNEAVGYQANYVPQGFNVLDEEKSQRALAAFDFMTEDGFDPSFLPDRFEQTVDELDRLENEPLEKKRQVASRREQQALRNWLFGNRKTGECILCGRTFPVDLMVTAHIKRRADCTREEKLDYRHNVVPMCKLGCDDLFERGYLVVEGGVIRPGKKDLLTETVRQLIEQVSGRTCPHWSEGSKPYFAYHRSYHAERAA